MNIENANDFYTEIVRPKCAHFLKNRPVISDGIFACMGLYHMREWVSVNSAHSPTEMKAYWNTIKVSCVALEHARLIVNSAKHCEPNSCDTVKLSEERIDEINPYHENIESTFQIIATHPDGLRYNVSEIVELGMAFWDNEIERLLDAGDEGVA